MFVIFFIVGLLGGIYLESNSTTPASFAIDTTGKVVNELETENVGFLFSPLNSVNINPLVISCILLILFIFVIFFITKTYGTLFTSALGLAGGLCIFFAPVVGFSILAFGIVYSLILQEMFE